MCAPASRLGPDSFNNPDAATWANVGACLPALSYPTARRSGPVHSHHAGLTDLCHLASRASGFGPRSGSCPPSADNGCGERGGRGRKIAASAHTLLVGGASPLSKLWTSPRMARPVPRLAEREPAPETARTGTLRVIVVANISFKCPGYLALRRRGAFPTRSSPGASRTRATNSA